MRSWTSRRVAPKRHVFGNVSGSFADAVEKRRLALMQPRQAQQIDTRRGRDAPTVDGPSLLVEDRQVDPVEVERIPGRPDHGADSCCGDVDLGDVFSTAIRAFG